MITAVVIRLRALEDGSLPHRGSRAVHGLWFRLWKQVDPALASALHKDGVVLPFTLSPLMGLPRRTGGQIPIRAGQEAWFRVVALTEALSMALMGKWLPALPPHVELAGLPWKVNGWTTSPDEHPWAGQTRYGELASRQLFFPPPARAWHLLLHTPTAFHGAAGHLPFPLPDSVVRSWMRRWQAFSPIAMPEDLVEQVRQGVVVSAYRLQTAPLRHGERLIVGCTGRVKIRARRLLPATRAAVNLLAHYAFYCGTGVKTTQGMGMTRLLA